MILALLAIVITLILVVGIHETGHALAAKLFGVKIKRIAIGFGKPLLSYKDKSGREWVWALWPLGGYVHLLNSRIEPVLEKEHYSLCFDKKPIWQRCIILLSGALANLTMAWLAFTMLFMLGYQQQQPLIQNVLPQSIAALAGLKAHDRFVEISGWKTSSWQDVGMSLVMTLGKKNVPVWVSNEEGGVRKVNLDLSQWHYKKKDTLLSALGIEAVPANVSNSFVVGQSFMDSIRHAFEQILYLLVFFLVMLKQLITGMIPFSVLLGPLGLFSVSITSFLQGTAVFLSFIASLSLAVGFVNLFPIPGLDGGSIVYSLVEKIRGKPMSIAVEVLLYRLAFIVFAVLLIQLLMNDLQRYLTR
ncbi:M50 family metallopeptidase [Legionella micdadei]|uniref:M50 family metallopeptidase n=1 Tax=Legionella micdadei TaxID=451 RepID=UPI0009EF7D3C|nr:site-2 protease family protein [Legionella micdadei]ARG99584.1 peptidase [Legionella micdadei]